MVFRLTVFWIILCLCPNLFASESKERPAKRILLKNVNIVDVHQLAVVKKQSILIEQDKILKIAPVRQLSRAKNAVVVDLKNKFIVPGLIDAHVHHATDPDGGDNLKETKRRLRALLQGGVTSVRDMGGDARVLAYLKRQAEIDAFISPDIYFSVIIGGDSFFSDPRTISSAKGRQPGHTAWMKAVDRHSDFDSVILQAKGLGATGIKIYADLAPQVVKPLAMSAKKHGLKVWSHAFIGPAKPLQTIEAGVETISHGMDLSAQVIDDFKQWRRHTAKLDEHTKQKVFKADNYLQLFARMKQENAILDATLTVFESRKTASEKSNLMHNLSRQMTKLAFENDVIIAAGTDAFADLSKDELPKIHHELNLLVNEIGMSPIQAIQAATLNGAKVIGVEKQIGSIEEGKVANLLIVKADPTSDIKNLGSIAHVIKNGQFISLGNDPRLPFANSR